MNTPKITALAGLLAALTLGTAAQAACLSVAQVAALWHAVGQGAVQMTARLV